MRIPLVLFLLVAAQGCYRYVPADRVSIVPGSEIRAELTESGSDEVRRYLGPDVRSLDGPLVASTSTGLAVLVESRVTRPGFPPTSFADTVRLGPDHIATMQVREMDRLRSVGFAALVTGGAIAALLGARAFGGSEGDSGRDLPDGDAQIRLRIPLRIGFD